MTPHSNASAPADADLLRRIYNFLVSRNYPALRGLHIRVDGGQVIVSGRVGSFHEKQLASSCAQRVAGVLEVINEVEVEARRTLPALAAKSRLAE